MKKLLAKILCLAMAFQLVCVFPVFAADAPVNVYFGAEYVVNPGEEASLTIDVVIKPDFNIQGVQIKFDFSDNFPTLKNTSIIKNTTGWENTGISKNNLLALGNIITKQSQLVGKITFDIPSDAAPGTEYIFTPTVIAANSNEEVEAKQSAESVKFVVAGGNPADSTQTPEIEPEITPEVKPQVPDVSENDNKPNVSTEDKTSENSPEKDQNFPSDATTSDGKKEEEILPWKNPFNDVKENAWFYDSVRYVFENELMSGVDTEVFAPNSTLTRAMLVTILYRFEGSPDSRTYAYSDVERNTWYTKGVDWAASNGIVNGVGDGKFAPNLPITREQITVIFYNYSKHKEMNLTAKKDLSAYADDNEISPWAATAFEWAAASGLISGKDNNKLDPSGNATRAETAAIIKRYTENLVIKK